MCDARNNIFYVTAAGTSFALLAETGTLTLANNWARSGWRNSFESPFGGTVSGGSSFVIGSDPGFVDVTNQNFRLGSGGQAVNAGTNLNPDVLPANDIARQYVQHQSSEARPANGNLDIGAYEFASVAPVQIVSTLLPNPVRFRFYFRSLQASGGSGNYLWSVSAGQLPPGLVLDTSSGVVHGAPRLKGTWNFTITAQDAQNASQLASRDFILTTKLHF